MTIRYIRVDGTLTEPEVQKLQDEHLQLPENEFLWFKQRLKENHWGIRGLPEDDFQKIKAQLERCEKLIQEFPDFRDLQDVTVLVLGGDCNPPSRSACYCCTKDIISITADPKQPCYNDPEDPTLGSGFAHELDHLVRWRGGRVGIRCLAYAIVSEGLAQAFERQATGAVGKISEMLSDDQLLAWEDHVKEMLGKREFDYRAIFSGSKDGKPYPDKDGKGYPRGFGYSFSYALVSAWLKHTGRTAADAVHIDVEEILLPWLKGEFSITGDTPNPPANRISVGVTGQPAPQ